MINFKILFFFICVFLLIGCENKVEIVKIPTEYTRRNTEGVINERICFFAVKNKKDDFINNYSKVFKDKVKNFSKIYLELIFYEYNSKLNENSVYGEGDDTIYHNGDYLICSYKWNKGQFLGKYIYEDGVLKEIQRQSP